MIYRNVNNKIVNETGAESPYEKHFISANMTEIQMMMFMLIKELCRMELPECGCCIPREAKEIAKQILGLYEISEPYSIFEIPVCCDDQVSIRFEFIDEKFSQSTCMFEFAAGRTRLNPNVFFIQIVAEPIVDDVADFQEFCLCNELAMIPEGY